MTAKVRTEELLHVLSTICSAACGTGDEAGTVDGGRISAAGAANGINSPHQFTVILSIVFDPIFFLVSFSFSFVCTALILDPVIILFN
jgi:hypothetical protein